MAILVGNEVPSPEIKTTQVYKATHEGTDYLSLRDRSFISFSYGGRNIEDFNIIVVFSGDRLQRAAYAQFEDVTTQYEVIDGQFYWGTHFLNNAIDFGLATDGMTEAELEDFKQWFKPGQIKELILAEHPNRAIWARVATSPVYSVMPFEEKVTKKINGIEYSTSSTIYRGEISLSFVMDEPYWFAKNNIIKTYYLDKNNKFNSMTDRADGAMETLSDKDFIKVIFEDNIPHASIKSNGIIFGDEGQTGVTVSENESQYFYYPGTATGKPRLTFTVKPHFNKSYITYPLNTYSPKILTNIKGINTYNTLSLGGATLKFTLPSMLLGYNQAINIISNTKPGEAAEDIRVALRDNVYDYNARGWAVYVLAAMIKNNWGIVSHITLGEDFTTKFIKYMSLFITEDGTEETAFPITVTIDSKTGEAVGYFTLRVPDVEGALPIEELDFSSQSTVILEKNVEDMVRSKYLVIEDHHRINDDGKITINDCSPITTDYPQEYGGLTDVKIVYKYEYL